MSEQRARASGEFSEEILELARERRDELEGSDRSSPGVRTSREFECPRCGRRCTEGLGGVEYGHRRGTDRGGSIGDCPRRPDCVDPGAELHRPDEDADG